MTIDHFAFAVGILAAMTLLAMLVWSIVIPDKRLWPPKEATFFVQLGVWGLTVTVFASAFVCGLFDWNSLDWPLFLRWGIGLPLIIIGNVVVWKAVINIGMKATSGEIDELKTGGFYKYSRNPQYVADIAILLGWSVLSASAAAIPVTLIGTIVLLIAPLAEEPWLKSVYGKAYEDYSQRVRRYL